MIPAGQTQRLGDAPCIPQIDKKRFFPVVCIIAAVLILVSVSLESVQAAVEGTYSFFSSSLTGCSSPQISRRSSSRCDRLRPLRQGQARREDAKPEYSKFSWIAMMFTTSCSAGLIVFGFIETTIYSSTAVPFPCRAFSIEAYEYAVMYTHYHWGSTHGRCTCPPPLPSAICSITAARARSA